jgi:antirestriction protein ArdC
MKVEEIITDKIIQKLKEGVVPWHKPWKGGAAWPKNLTSKKEYHGINAFTTAMQGYDSPYWLSFKQLQEVGGSVKKGQHGTPIVYWNFKEIKNGNGDVEKKIPFMRYYTVFNTDQCENIPEDKLPTVPAPAIDPIAACEAIVENMPNKPTIEFGVAKAYYNPKTDVVNLPPKKVFDGSQELYCTMFHELTHSTGHASRLARKEVTEGDTFGTPAYAKEELTAEMGAAFLCGYANIESKLLDNSAAYIKTWLNLLNDDPKLVIIAAGKAQKAVDYIMPKIDAPDKEVEC